MEERGEVLKITRGRWESIAPESADAAVEDVAAEEAQGDKKGDVKGKKSAKRDIEEHVWVTRGMWEERKEAGAAGRERRAEAKTAAERAEGDSELRAKYGLESTP
ncbi:hypothetical protein RQP46_000968 [Phenoliferia psychrophenolica]